MALPQIQQARIIQAPGVFDYAMREGPNIAQAFTSGLAAGQRMKEAKTAEENRKADKLDREKAKKQSFEMEFGQDIITNPQTGEVDIPMSRQAQERRKAEEQFAEWAGSAEAGGKQAAGVDDAIRQSPAYKRGQVRGILEIQKEMDALNRITKREEEAQKRQMEIERIQQEGRQKIEQDRNQARFLETILGGGGRPASAGASTISVVERPDGTSVTRKFRTEEELRAFQDEQARQAQAGGGTGDKEFEDAAREAIRQYEAFKARGVGADLDFDSKGIPKVTPSRFWDSANDDVIDALRRKVEPRAQPAGRTPVPLNSLIR